MTHTKDKEDGLWCITGLSVHFMYYNNVFMDFKYCTREVVHPKSTHYGDTLVIPYEFL